jgi:glycosyltransferase involved in cell wall biosynthesis
VPFSTTSEVVVRKILVVSGLQIYPPESGGMLRTSSLIGALVARGFDVTVYSMVGRKPDYLAGKRSGTELIKERLREYVDRGRFWAALQFAAYRLGLPPFWITLILALHIPRKLREALAACDAVIIDFPFLFPLARATAKPVALNTHNVEADLLQRPWAKRLVASIERRAAQSVRQVFCCSESDRAFFAPLVGGGQTSIVPNGIDPARFAGIAAQRVALRAALGYTDEDRVLFFAASSFGPNVEALAWLKGFVAENQALLTSRKLQFLVAGSVSKQPFELPRLKAVGTVARIEPYFGAADLAFNGVFRGSGTNLKMAEFIAAGLPILTSTAGMRGYDLIDGEDCIAFTTENLAGVLAGSAVLDDPVRLAAMARSAYEKNKRVIDMNWCVEPLIAWLELPR